MSTYKFSLAIIGLALVTILAATVALASEVTGMIFARSAKSLSSIEGTLSSSLAVKSGEAVLEGSSEEAITSLTASRSGGRRAASVESSDDPMILLDDGSIAPQTSLNGTGGGFDQGLEDFLAGQTGDGALSPSDAVAYNNSSRNPLVSNTDFAAVAEGSGMSPERLWSAIILGLALLGLAGYAVHALVGYRRENDL